MTIKAIFGTIPESQKHFQEKPFTAANITAQKEASMAIGEFTALIFNQQVDQLLTTPITDAPKLSPESQEFLEDDILDWSTDRHQKIEQAYLEYDFLLFKSTYLEYVALVGQKKATETVLKIWNHAFYKKLNKFEIDIF